MAKRRLNKQQLERIQENQREYLQRMDDDDSVFQGLVVAVFGKTVEVEDREQKRYTGQPRQNLGAIVCGDEVICQSENEDTVAIVALCERRTLLQRTTKQNQSKVVAANVDLMCITMAAEPEYHLELLDRYLVAAEHSHITALIIFNKVDLLNDTQLTTVQQQLSVYEQLGYKVVYFSSKKADKDALQTLQQQLASHTTIFVGQSGVGKSSLLQCLLPGESLATGALSEKQRKGTHTTTLSRLYHLPGGGRVIDSPGIRDYVLTHLQEEEIYRGFIELQPFLGECQFRDCRHENEPGCAVVAAVEQGEISPARYQSLRNILSWNRSN